MTDFSGYYAALLTPFSPDGSAIRDDVLARLVRRNVDAGLTGLYVGGSTGEAFLMCVEERIRLMAVASEAAGRACVLIAHIGDLNPAVSLQLAKQAQNLGYDAVSAVPPFYYGYSFAELKAHYAELAQATALPFVIYNFPALTGVRLSSVQLAELLELPGIVGIKNTCGDHYALEQLRRLSPDRVILNGFDETLLAGMSLGTDGGIGSTYNVQADKVLKLAASFAEGDVEEARRIQAAMNGFIDVITHHGVLPSLKFVLGLQGLEMGDCRPPFLPLSSGAKASLEQAVDKYLDLQDISVARSTDGE
ncbi:N-acetylneuraminate lyase [uncultured Nitratireductor sp.]|uniref:N-acetylneuraminate lyase n=1 Tax=uncultured Nitratireductor sp. TaxID=520953 RepID=UPI0026009BC1|nr:N-acetylneuraminate lyase [uncultured Nitratireductor sp.]